MRGCSSRLRRGSLEVVVCGPAEDRERLLAVGEQPLLLHRHRHPVARVGVHDVVQVRMVEVNRAMDDEPGLVHAEVRAAHHVARPVHPDEGRGRDLLEEEAEGVQQEFVLGTGDPGRDVGVVEVRPAVERAEAVGGREVAAHRPLVAREPVRDRVCRVKVQVRCGRRHRFSVSRRASPIDQCSSSSRCSASYSGPNAPLSRSSWLSVSSIT